MTQPRWTVKWQRAHGCVQRLGWVICLSGRVITVPRDAGYGEAEARMWRLAKHYADEGWV